MERLLLSALQQGGILAELAASDKAGVLEELLLLPEQKLSIPGPALMAAVLERENLASTGIGGGIALPHGRLEEIEEGVLVFGKSRKGVPFDAIDGRPVHLFFLFLTPLAMPELHLEMLAGISKFLRTPGVKERLRMGKTVEALFAVLSSA